MCGNDNFHRLAKEVAPEITRCMGGGNAPWEIVDRAIKYDCKKVQLVSNKFDKAMVDKAHENGIICNVFQADKEELAKDIDRILWYHDNKPHGFDVQELRLGGLLMRLRSQRDRLADFVEGRIDSIPELEEEILPYRGSGHAAEGISEIPYYHGWAFSATVNRLY